MENKKFKILVLSDLKKHTNSAMASAVSLSKMIGAEVDLFHVKKPTEVVGTDSQLSAIRVLNEEQNKSRNKIMDLINPLIETYGVNITFNFGIGHVKSEIETYIEATKPDVIVLGKRNPKVIKFAGDRITDFILKTYTGSVMIVSNENGLVPETDLNIGLLNGKSQVFNQAFTEDLMANTCSSLKSFNLVNSINSTEEQSKTYINKAVDFVFEKNDNTIKNLSSYLEKNQVNLLLVNRADNSDMASNNSSEIKNVINHVNVSLFITSRIQKQAV